MNSGSASGAVHVLYMVLFMGASGCAATSMVGRGTRALEKTAKSMDQTRDALRESDQTMKELVSSLEKLQAPMKTLGTLTGPMRNLSALGTPLQNVAALSPQMERLGTRLEGVETNLQRLETPLFLVRPHRGRTNAWVKGHCPLRGRGRGALVYVGGGLGETQRNALQQRRHVRAHGIRR
jgi:hypothetical protein